MEQLRLGLQERCVVDLVLPPKRGRHQFPERPIARLLSPDRQRAFGGQLPYVPGDEILQNRAIRIVQIQLPAIEGNMLPAPQEDSADGVVKPSVALRRYMRAPGELPSQVEVEP